MENVIKEVGLNAINTIASKIKATNEKIWANEAFTKYTMRNVNIFKSENAEMENQMKELEADLSRNETYIKQIRSTTELVKMSLKTTCESIQLMNYMKTLQTERTKFFTSRYSNELAECRKRFNEHKSTVESTNPLHKELKDLIISKKLLEIQVLDIKQKLEDQRNIKKQYRKIQKDIWHRDVIRFAKACLDHYKARDVFHQLKLAESEEKELIKKVFYLQKKANERKMLNFRSSIKSAMPAIDFSTFFSAEEEHHTSKEQWVIQQKLQELADQQVKKSQKKPTEISLPASDLKNPGKQQMETQSQAPVHQRVKFTPNKSKVRILEDVKVVPQEAKVNSNRIAKEALSTTQKTTSEELANKKPPSALCSQSSTKGSNSREEASLSQQKSLSQTSIICDMLRSQERTQMDQSNDNLKMSQEDTVLSKQQNMQNNGPTRVQGNVRNTFSEDKEAQQIGISPNLAKSSTSDFEHTPFYPITNPTPTRPQIANEMEKQSVLSPFFQPDVFAPFLSFCKKNVPADEEMKEKKSYPEQSVFGFGSKMDAEKLLFSGIQSPADAIAANSTLNLTGKLDVSQSDEMQWSPPLQLARPDGTQEGSLGFQDSNKCSAPESNQFSFGASSFFNMF